MCFCVNSQCVLVVVYVWMCVDATGWWMPARLALAQQQRGRPEVLSPPVLVAGRERAGRTPEAMATQYQVLSSWTTMSVATFPADHARAQEVGLPPSGFKDTFGTGSNNGGSFFTSGSSSSSSSYYQDTRAAQEESDSYQNDDGPLRTSMSYKNTARSASDMQSVRSQGGQSAVVRRSLWLLVLLVAALVC